MVVPGLYDVPKVMAESSLSEEDVLNLGFSADGLVFMVVVPELGACRVPDLALSHFMAGADEYAAEGMPEHWSKQPSGPWTIKRDRLRILADSWDKWHQMVCDRWITEPPDASEPQAPPVVANIASNAPVVPFKKAALIAAHMHEWPTIERDISDANTNGLAAAAKAGERGWLEAGALNWARAKGKLISTAKPADSLAQAMHRFGTLPSWKHTMRG